MIDTLDVVQNPSQDDIDFLRDNLITTNREFVGEQIRRPLAIFYQDEQQRRAGGCSGYQDEQQRRAGGCSGHTYGNWLYIEYLWVASSLRGRGVGGRLLAAMEQAARERGCRFSQLDTFSFQAKPFYQARGYSVVMTLEKCPVFHQRYYLTKTL
ncbi:GNAT family N-acetyltransferase [Aeromonas veronii]|uniref:GNAT family N-acetyltransferase n=1 Tax=Aeromonas veronii TaxID=654 RepID=UPI002B4AAB87|nr:GNAT family N-acetyltransferase [Aeromonas veronii]